MKRQKDYTPHICAICKETVPCCGMGSHLYHKHGKMSSDRYAQQFGEFRKKYLTQLSKKASTEQLHICKECSFVALTFKQLSQHISKYHPTWQEYYIKHYFNGTHPTCQCGCGEPVKLLRHGKDETGKQTFARNYLSGHNIHLPGYRTNTLEQRQRMREAAIKRMEKGNSVFHRAGPSKNELQVQEFVESLGIQASYNDTTLLGGLEIDILIASKKLAIEYNGIRFHSDLFKKKSYHLKKTQEVNELGYHLVHIWEPDWIKSAKIVQSNLKHLLGLTTVKYYARNLEIRQVPATEAAVFLKENHLQGSTPARHRLGLYTREGILVSLMTFSNARAVVGGKKQEGIYELVRFCNKLDTVAVGGASKLFKAFIKQVNPDSIYSYANRDWSLGKLYISLGMSYESSTPPGYFYVKSNYKYSRQQFQKHKLVAAGKDPNKTEYEIMTEDGYYRVWDCGNLKYRWNKEGF